MEDLKNGWNTNGDGDYLMLVIPGFGNVAAVRSEKATINKPVPHWRWTAGWNYGPDFVGRKSTAVKAMEAAEKKVKEMLLSGLDFLTQSTKKSAET